MTSGVAAGGNLEPELSRLHAFKNSLLNFISCYLTLQSVGILIRYS